MKSGRGGITGWGGVVLLFISDSLFRVYCRRCMYTTVKSCLTLTSHSLKLEEHTQTTFLFTTYRFSLSQGKNCSEKPIAVDVLSKAYPVIPLSCSFQISDTPGFLISLSAVFPPPPPLSFPLSPPLPMSVSEHFVLLAEYWILEDVSGGVSSIFQHNFPSTGKVFRLARTKILHGKK